MYIMYVKCIIKVRKVQWTPVAKNGELRKASATERIVANGFATVWLKCP